MSSIPNACGAIYSIAQLSLEVTRQLYPWGLAMLSIIHCASQLGTPTIRYNVRIVM